MINYDKLEIRDQLSIDNIFELLHEWGGDPEYTVFGIISATICHNEPGEGSRKLYYYLNSGLFQCYTGCAGYFDIFELVRKIADIQWHEEYDLNDAVRWIARRFGISGTAIDDEDVNQLEDWKLLAGYDRIQEAVYNKQEIVLKEYDNKILNFLNYSLKIDPWLKEGISDEALKQAKIGYYPVGEQISIPHFDKDGRFIGLRGRALIKDEAEIFGKYRPMKINKILYNHPLGMNLYNYNFAKENIRKFKKVIIFEGEKSCLLYKSYFGIENDISVACCGSSISNYQIQLLLDLGVEEIIIAFDRQFVEIGDNEFNLLKKKLLKIKDKFGVLVNITFIFDKNMIIGYKDSPIDCGRDIFLKLFQERLVL